MKRKIIIGIVFIILLSIFIFASNIDNFVGQDDPFNITFENGKEVKTEYIDIPKYAYVKNISIKIEGFQTT